MDLLPRRCDEVIGLRFGRATVPDGLERHVERVALFDELRLGCLSSIVFFPEKRDVRPTGEELAGRSGLERALVGFADAIVRSDVSGDDLG